MDLVKPRRKPKLERRNAVKYSDYDTASSSSSSFDDYSSGSLYTTRSMELHHRTSFRIEGIEGEFDRICRSLGLSGPEDFAIPAASWEALKVRSNSDVLPRRKLMEKEEEEEEGKEGVESELRENFEERVSVKVRDEPGETSGCCNNDSGGGIKGTRPMILKPPPGLRVPVVDSTCSTWDLLRDFAPQGGEEQREAEKEEEEVGGRREEEEEEEEEEEVGEDNVEIVDELAGSGLFSTSNEDDSSSTNTEPRSNNISPNARIKRVITPGNWQKGDLLGRGSFGSVYEGISE